MNRGSVLSLALGLTGIFAACGGDDTPAPIQPKDPPTLSVKRLASVGGPVLTPGGGETCLERGRDAAQTVVVDVAVTDFLLRPPGLCGTNSRCGRIVLRVNPTEQGEELRVESVQRSVDLSLAALSDGPHTFRAELVDEAGRIVVDGDDVVSDEISVDLHQPFGCGVLPDGGADAGDAATDAPAEAGDAGDAATDAPTDADEAGDAVTDAPTDAGDAGDAGADAATDAPSD